MNEQEIIIRFEKIEKRINALENKSSEQKEEIKKVKEDFSGLAGGIRFLIKNNFLDSPKSVSEIYEELKKEKYHYPKKSAEKLLSVNFMKSQKILNRVKEDHVWKYVIRK